MNAISTPLSHSSIHSKHKEKGHGVRSRGLFVYHTIFEVSSQSVAIVGISGADITIIPQRCEMEEEKNEVAVFNGVEMRISSLDDIWLSQKQIAQMFNKDVRTINGHVETVKKELANWEGLNSTIRKNRIVQIEGNREVKREIEVYGFEFICQIGYKVNSVRGTQFRQFATKAVMEKLNRDLLNRDERENALRIENEALKSRLGEAVMEISELEMKNDYLSQYEPDEKDYGKIAKNGYPRTTYQRGGFKSRGGRKVALKPKYVTIDLLAVAKYLQQ